MFRLRLSAVLVLFPVATTCHGGSAIAQITPAGESTGTIVEQAGDAFAITGGSTSGDNSNLFHNFNDFNLGTGQSATFLANPQIQNILSRVSGGNPSFIDGLIEITNSDANLFLLNPSGLVFGSNAQLNVAGDFTASTAWGAAFEDGDLWIDGVDYAQLTGSPTNFFFDGTGAIINAGDLNVAPGQALNLFASNVVNTGNLTAKEGKIQAIAVPGSNTLRLSQDGQILGLELTPPTSGNFTATNLPELLTGSGLDGVINSDYLDAESGRTLISGNLDATGNIGGDIGVFGRHIFLESANLNASGMNGGGQIFVGGDYRGGGTLPTAFNTFVDRNSVLDSRAIATGDAGQIIVWADNATGFYGEAIATGGALSGDGGLVETSGKIYLDVFGANVNASAVNGQSGLWLLDPTNINIVNTGTGLLDASGNFEPTSVSPTSDISPDTIEAALEGGTSVLITTVGSGTDAGDITLEDSIVTTNPVPAGTTLTLRSRLFNQDLGGTTTINIGAGNLLFELNAVNPESGISTLLGDSIQAAHNAIGAVTGTATINIGAGAGAVTARKSVPAAFSFTTDLIINGAGAGLVFLDGTGSLDRVILATADLTINDLTIQNGAIAPIGDGAGISFSGGNLALTDVTIRNNTSLDRGGGIFNDGGDVTLTRVELSGNTATSGGGIFNDDGTVTITDSLIDNNDAIGTTGTEGGGGIFNDAAGDINLLRSTVSGNTSDNIGGGIVNNGDTLDIQDSTISGNTAVNGGGGIDNYSAGQTLNLRTSVVTGNVISAGGGYGGGIKVGAGGTATITDSLITANRVDGALSDGGGIVNFGNTTLLRTTVSGNRANGSGGGIFNNYNDDLTLQDSTVSGNTATGAGGGIFNDGNTDLFNSTILGNTATGAGGGIANGYGGSGTTVFLDITNSIIANSSGADIEDTLSPFGRATTAAGENIVENSAVSIAGNPVITDDPSLMPLGDYGGLDVGDPNTGTSPITTHFFFFDSPALNAGDNAAVISTTDQRGGSRIVDVAVDLGAVEFQGVSLSLVGGDGQSTAINTDFGSVTVAATEVTFNNILENLEVQFDAPNSGASSNPTSLSGTTNSAGQVSVTPTANSVVGSFEIQATTPAFSVSNTASATLENTDTPNIDDFDPGDGGAVIEDCLTGADCAGDDPNMSNPDDQLADDNGSNLAVITGKLEKIQEQTGVNPALIYVFFVPSEEEDTLVSTKAESGKDDLTKDVTQWSYRGDRLSDFLNAEEKFLNPPEKLDNDEELELVMVTYSGKVIRKKVPGVTRENVMPLVSEFVAGVTSPRFGDRYMQPAQALHNIFIDPLEPDIEAEQINNLTFIMDEGFRALPVAALHDGDKFLIEKYSVGMMPSFSLTNTSGYIPPRQNQLLAMGASEFNGLDDLPAAPLEVEIIADQIWQGTSFVEQQFTVENLLAARERNPYSIVHLATHGEFRSGQNDRSFIQFHDQRITMNELSRLRLNEPPIELLVLSACRTALGDRQAELGFAGLALASGAKSAIGSIWYVSDEGTLALMTGLYENLQKSPIKAEALQQAQLSLLRKDVYAEGNKLMTSNGSITLPPEVGDVSDQDFAHPYFWSGFALIGNPW
ncbi:CHAT domain-containing protein [[Limnothrix rosea] IAM M-220]|uniref:CHAT domain-containing protein n=1 Tax=[Limnothrix rosea] IAM M-220 TaxID=454133 RepID=UPI000961E79F|nr:CHAT domain-containing protein [[Limnothrix rosea] IAM M-220]OKH13829.1 hypothetical protein NIES208_14455 [[Limnothrix rosea] IAM M-220]